MRRIASSTVEQCSTPISKSLKTRRRIRTVFSSELTNNDFRFILPIVIRSGAPLEVHQADSPLRSLDALLAFEPRNSSCSHSKSVGFRNQCHGSVLRLLQSRGPKRRCSRFGAQTTHRHRWQTVDSRPQIEGLRRLGSAWGRKSLYSKGIYQKLYDFKVFY